MLLRLAIELTSAVHCGGREGRAPCYYHEDPSIHCHRETRLLSDYVLITLSLSSSDSPSQKLSNSTSTSIPLQLLLPRPLPLPRRTSRPPPCFVLSRGSTGRSVVEADHAARSFFPFGGVFCLSVGACRRRTTASGDCRVGLLDGAGPLVAWARAYHTWMMAAKARPGWLHSARCTWVTLATADGQGESGLIWV